MGDIYKAQDPRLNRFVAIKVLIHGAGDENERRRRFIQEAQAASALNHPNIITIYDIVSEPDADFMVMEFVAGKTLLDLIAKGGLHVPQALQIALQMTDALAVAHASGIVHRDLKPANVMVTDAGLVKILDFGLAKLTGRAPLAGHDDKTQTGASSPLTLEGSIIGTASYMSPEQAQGHKVDARSDIFSFGVVLYEMITGVRAFQGESALSTLLAILRDQTKPVAELAPGAPPQIEHLIQRCLGKKPDDRWQSMQDVRAALAALKHESDSGQLYKPRVAAAGSRKLAPGALAIGAAAVLLAGAGGVWWMTHRGTAQPVAVAPARPESIPTPVAEPAETVLSNDSIIEMVQAKVAASNVLGAIRSSKTNFDLSPAEIIRLTKSGVPASVIEAMRDPKSIPDQAVAVTLTDGSPLRIELAADIPADAPEGQTIGFTTSEDFRAGDHVLIPRGASVTGAIVEAAGKKKLRFIGGSKLTFRLIDLDAGDGRRLHVRCTLKKRADGAPPSRPVENSKHRHSKEVAAAAGAAYVAYIDGDQTISIRK